MKNPQVTRGWKTWSLSGLSDSLSSPAQGCKEGTVLGQMTQTRDDSP